MPIVGRFFTFLEKQFLRSIMFYVIHSFRVRGIGPSIILWAGEIGYCCRANDRFLLSRLFLDPPEASLGEGNNPFQATYYSIAREVLSIVRDQDGPVSLCDIGAGNGRVASIALDLGFQDVYGIEIDGRWQAALRALRDQTSSRFDFIIGDALEVMPQRRFDALFLFNPMNREKFSRFLEGMKHRGSLPSVFVLVNPEYDDLMVGVDYKESLSRSTGKHVEYRVFRRQKPQKEVVAAYRPGIGSSPRGRSDPKCDGAAL